MKFGRNKLTVNQAIWMNDLQDQGYYTMACWGFEEAQEHILRYLSLEPGARWV
jgi:hypothetical protein